MPRLPSRATWTAIAVGAAVFWTPAVLLRLRMEEQEQFWLAIGLFGVLLPVSMLLVWRAWFDAPTRAERLARWVRLALWGPYAGSVLVGTVSFFCSNEFARFNDNPNTPTVAGVLLPVTLLTVRAALTFLHYSTFLAFGVLLVITVFIPRGALRATD